MATARDLNQRTRAAWAYSRLQQDTLAAKAEIPPERLRRLLHTKAPAMATDDELAAIARETGVPEAFVFGGFAGVAEAASAENDGDLREELQALRGLVGGLLWDVDFLLGEARQRGVVVDRPKRVPRRGRRP